MRPSGGCPDDAYNYGGTIKFLTFHWLPVWLAIMLEPVAEKNSMPPGWFNGVPTFTWTLSFTGFGKNRKPSANLFFQVNQFSLANLHTWIGWMPRISFYIYSISAWRSRKIYATVCLYQPVSEELNVFTSVVSAQLVQPDGEWANPKSFW